MPILTCPTCGSKLEVADEDMGHTVQCGSCQQTFTAEDESRPKSGGSKRPYTFKERNDDEDDDRPSRRSRRDDDEDDRPSRRRRDEDDEDDPDADYRPRRSRRSRYDDDDYDRRYRTPQTGMGVTSLVMGIIAMPMGFCCGLFSLPVSILGLIFGIMAQKTEGKGMGMAGIIMSVIGFIIAVIMVILGFVLRANGGPGGGFGPGGGGGGGGF